MAAPFEVKTRPFVFLKDINEKKDFWKIAVRVRDKWTVVKDGREHLEMVIVDAKVIWLQGYHLIFYESWSNTLFFFIIIGY
jgi:hypothetical protein